MDIQAVIETINDSFAKHHKDKKAFTVDYDEDTDSLYCNYCPSINDSGFAVTDNLLKVDKTSQKDLFVLQEWLIHEGIRSRNGHEWKVDWGNIDHLCERQLITPNQKLIGSYRIGNDNLSMNFKYNHDTQQFDIFKPEVVVKLDAKIDPKNIDRFEQLMMELNNILEY